MSCPVYRSTLAVLLAIALVPALLAQNPFQPTDAKEPVTSDARKAAETALERGKEHLKKKETDKALAAFEEAMKLDKTYAMWAPP